MLTVADRKTSYGHTLDTKPPSCAVMMRNSRPLDGVATFGVDLSMKVACMQLSQVRGFDVNTIKLQAYVCHNNEEH
jgi:hypothetical protein